MHYAAPERCAALELQTGPAQGGWFDDGNEHVIGARREGDRWTFTLDGIEQLSCDRPDWRPQGIVVSRAAVAVYSVAFS